MSKHPASKTPASKNPRKSQSLKLDPAVVADLFAPAPAAPAPVASKSPAPADPAGKPAVPAPEVMVAAVRDYALQYYNDGWDFVVECWTDADILQEIKGAKSEKGAIRKVWHVVSEQIAQRKEIQAA